MSIAIQVEGISKHFKLYENQIDRLKEAISPLRKQYHTDFYALNNVSFHVKKGETLGILGKNGSGKSTLLKIITGVLTPTEGKVQINGKIAALLELGAGFNPEYTGIENIYLNGMLMGFDQAEMDRRLENILSFADIGDFVYQPVKNYSSGMFARLAFAVAINVEPEILIIDEALSVGDIFFQQKCFEKIKAMKNEGVTILFVSHDVTSVSTLCDRCVLINKGEVYSYGEPRKIINDYVKLYNTNDEITKKIERVNKLSKKGNLSLIDAATQSDSEEDSEEYRYGDESAIISKIECLNDNSPDSDWLVYTMDSFKLRITVDFYEDCTNPVLGFYIKNKKGLEMYSGNTHYLNQNIGPVKGGEKVTVTFSQKMYLAPDEYIVSIGLSDYVDGTSRPLDRRYDVNKITVKSERTIIGLMDMDSTVEIVKGG
ncbi:ABC transporter ATP-binding protein [Paenibacillus medicaginis]|uniref:ABC transporter ATP-binding protein n=1 Tax=Paenibacillus medicaginis TaxID=1470560 RepID=A0ABV5C8D6_9BACL